MKLWTQATWESCSCELIARIERPPQTPSVPNERRTRLRVNSQHVNSQCSPSNYPPCIVHCISIYWLERCVTIVGPSIPKSRFNASKYSCKKLRTSGDFDHLEQHGSVAENNRQGQRGSFHNNPGLHGTDHHLALSPSQAIDIHEQPGSCA